ncbi:hypothetical protein [Streptomyces cinerochromogenes]|uniref:hypothetical protein n=1 Tax=Streptomyces cinerochromogenes TaxID=66422 RepID=UPI0033B6C799
MKHLIRTCVECGQLRSRQLAVIIFSVGAIAGGVLLPAVTSTAVHAPAHEHRHLEHHGNHFDWEAHWD